jgi:hypothetical protein
MSDQARAHASFEEVEAAQTLICWRLQSLRRLFSPAFELMSSTGSRTCCSICDWGAVKARVAARWRTDSGLIDDLLRAAFGAPFFVAGHQRGRTEGRERRSPRNLLGGAMTLSDIKIRFTANHFCKLGVDKQRYTVLTFRHGASWRRGRGEC